MRVLAQVAQVVEKQRDALDYITLVVAIVGLSLGLVTLTWQVLQWRLSGHRVRVSAAAAFVTSTTGELSAPLVAVSARNVGRAAVTVTSWGFKLPDSKALTVFVQLPGATPLPHRLEAFAEAKFYVERAGVEPYVHLRPRPFVGLATGEDVIGKPLAGR